MPKIIKKLLGGRGRGSARGAYSTPRPPEHLTKIVIDFNFNCTHMPCLHLP